MIFLSICQKNTQGNFSKIFQLDVLKKMAPSFTNLIISYIFIGVPRSIVKSLLYLTQLWWFKMALMTRLRFWFVIL